jgi:hypothetical protein
MDPVWILHVSFIVFFLSIPFWPVRYLKYGVFLPLALATVWIVFDGCPLTRIQRDLNDEYFSRVLLRYFIPDISNEATARASYYILLLVVTIGMVRLKTD